MNAVKAFLLTVFFIVIYTTTLFAQNNIGVTPIPRNPDYEYLSAPDSLGNRNPLLMPSNNGQRGGNQSLPYPVIFIHGLNSNSNTWLTTASHLANQYGLSY